MIIYVFNRTLVPITCPLVKFGLLGVITFWCMTEGQLSHYLATDSFFIESDKFKPVRKWQGRHWEILYSRFIGNDFLYQRMKVNPKLQLHHTVLVKTPFQVKTNLNFVHPFSWFFKLHIIYVNYVDFVFFIKKLLSKDLKKI